MTTDNISASYSRIINPEDYNRIITEEHLYIAASDQFIIDFLKYHANASKEVLEVVEVGCGPARLLRHAQYVKNIRLTGLDIDPNFIEYTKTLIANPEVSIVNASVINYQHKNKVDIFFSQGFHHHVSKGDETNKYLKNVYNNLKPGGYYIISDEFIPNYLDESEREIKLVIWYSHIIAHALKKNFIYLAQEEAKTLLDDLNIGWKNKNIKTQSQVGLVLAYVEEIDGYAVQKHLKEACIVAEQLLKQLKGILSTDLTHDVTMDLSRGDYKICESVLLKEVEEIGFKLKNSKSFGPIETIGAMTVYIFEK